VILSVALSATRKYSVACRVLFSVTMSERLLEESRGVGRKQRMEGGRVIPSAIVSLNNDGKSLQNRTQSRRPSSELELSPSPSTPTTIVESGQSCTCPSWPYCWPRWVLQVIGWVRQCRWRSYDRTEWDWEDHLGCREVNQTEV